MRIVKSNIVFWGVLLFLMIGCSSKNKFHINGSVEKNMSVEGRTVYLYNSMGHLLDSTTLRNSNFVLKGKLPEDPYDRSAFLLIKGSYYLPVILESDGIIHAEMSSQGAYGTPLNNVLRDFESGIDAIETKYYEDFRRIVLKHVERSNTYKILDSLYNDMNIEKIDFSLNVLRKHPNDIMGVWSLHQIINCINPQMKQYSINDIMAIASPFVQQSPFLREKIEQYNNKILTAKGKVFSDFEGIDRRGNRVRFSDICKEGSYTVVYFGNYFCEPCKKEKNILNTLYKKYSSDKIKFIEVALQDKFLPQNTNEMSSTVPWMQICDDKEEAFVAYNVNVIPEFMIIDPYGFIVERNLRGSALVTFLEKISSLSYSSHLKGTL